LPHDDCGSWIRSLKGCITGEAALQAAKLLWHPKPGAMPQATVRAGPWPATSRSTDTRVGFCLATLSAELFGKDQKIAAIIAGLIAATGLWLIVRRGIARGTDTH